MNVGRADAKTVLPLILTTLAACGTGQEAEENTGALTSQIIGGRDIPIKRRPYQVALWDLEFESLLCGGSIINRKWVLTAAHCAEFVDDTNIDDFQIIAGVSRISDMDTWRAQVRGYKTVVVHPDYIDPVFGADVALVEVDESFDLSTRGVSGIELLSPNDGGVDWGLTESQARAKVSGWGALNDDEDMPDQLQKANVRIKEQQWAERNTRKEYVAALEEWTDYCELLLEDEEASEEDQEECSADLEWLPEEIALFENEWVLTDDQLAAGKYAGGKDSCWGDSGGPLTVENAHGEEVLAGVVSWGIGCAERRLPGIYARVSELRGWILDQIN